MDDPQGSDRRLGAAWAEAHRSNPRREGERCSARGADPDRRLMTVESATITDSQLMRQASATSVGAFAELYDRYCNRAYRVAFSVCRDDGRAQDAVQDAFLSVWRSRPTTVPSGVRSPRGC